MFLNKLVVSSPSTGIIREINFHLGVNLILDESIHDESGTGNSVGKTTALRSIDFCLGAKQELFYEDNEFKTENEEVKSFLIGNRVKFSLTISDSNDKDILIERTISPDSKVDCKINEVSFPTIASFHESLKVALFHSTSEKPSFRQIMTRVIRNTPEKMSNTLNTLYKSSIPEYEALNLFMFGFKDASVLNKKLKLDLMLKKVMKEYSVISKLRSKNALEQALNVVNRDIEARQLELNDFNLGDAYKEQLSNLNKIKMNVASLSNALASLQMKASLNRQAKDNLLAQIDNTDPEELELLYKEAELRVGELSKTFEQVLSFHNEMIIKKVEFIGLQSSELENKISNVSEILNTWLHRESTILKQLSSMGSLSDLQVLQAEINKSFEEKGKLENALEQIISYEYRIEELKIEMSVVTNSIKYYLSDFNKRLDVFNAFFSEYTKSLYDDEYILSYSESKENFRFSVDPLASIRTQGNIGDGKKKAQVSAFDLALLAMKAELNDRSIRFVAHDGIEAIHGNQIRKLFEIASGIAGQYILSILKDKLNYVDEDFIKENTVLELSETNKFFKC